MDAKLNSKFRAAPLHPKTRSEDEASTKVKPGHTTSHGLGCLLQDKIILRSTGFVCCVMFLQQAPSAALKGSCGARAGAPIHIFSKLHLRMKRPSRWLFKVLTHI